MTLQAITAILLIAVPVAFNLAFFELGRSFDGSRTVTRWPRDTICAAS
jgi:hypothetical protein